MLDFLKGKVKKKNTEQDEQPKDTREISLLFLVEKSLPDMKNYFKSRGISIIEIYNDIEEAKIGLLIQSGACRLVIVEAGLGKFTTTSMRAELSDLLGMCDGTDKKATIFYTDTIIKSENTKGRKNNGVDWIVYDNTVGVINKLLSYNERYTPTEDSKSKLDTHEVVMKFKGETVQEIKNAVRPPDDSQLVDSLLEIMRSTEEYEAMPSFEPIY